MPSPESGTSVGAAGGVVTSADGRAELSIPAGALSAPVSFLLQPASNLPLDPAAVGQSAYEILPAGVTFEVAARLRVLYFPNLRPSGTAEAELRLHHLIGGAWALDTTAPEVDAGADAVIGSVGGSGTFGARWPDPTEPCALAEDRLFDFWLGEWSFAQTVPVVSSGNNSITRDAEGCRILENFNGGRGRSVSFFSRNDNRWHQTYIDTDGNRVVMAGAFEDGRMRLYSSPAARWTWERLESGDVRYFGESQGGGTWTVTFDSRYAPTSAGQAPTGFCASQSFTAAAESPYALPYAVGSSHVMFQGNCSTLGGHRNTFAYDFDMPMGTPVLASRAGIVTFANDQYADTDHVSGHENNVFVRHGDGTVIRYTHLRQDGAAVAAGDLVEPGTTLGFSGNSGASTSPHLHLQAFRDGTSFDAGNSIPLTFHNAGGTIRSSGELIEGQSYLAQPVSARQDP